MGSQCDPSKRFYDITMSKRTRKPILDLQENNNNNNHTSPSPAAASSKWDVQVPLKTIASVFDQSSPRTGDQHHQEELESDHRKSLKQLINGDENGKEIISSSGRSSLSHHFTEEEKQLQVVKKNQQDNSGVKLKGMMSRYAKVLSHLVRVKREPHIGSRKKKHLLRLTK
ncbi:hypothetical protein PTKIN_Ptkin13bG0157500 [Pterospermum kingtungense]